MALSELVPTGGLPNLGAGPIATSYATLIPPGARVAAYVRSGGYQELDPFRADDLVTTLAAALPRVRSGYGDVIIVLPGHVESVVDATMLDNLRAGTTILGIGRGSMQPTFNFTATASQWTLDQSDVLVQGLRLNVDGANGVVNAIDVTAADCVLRGCAVRLASGAALKATVGVSLSAARAWVDGCYFEGTATHFVARAILIDTAVDGIKVTNTRIIASATAANGLIGVTAAATNLLFQDLLLYNTHTSSTATIALSDVACDGFAIRVKSGTKNNGGAKTTQGITWGASALVQAHDCTCSDVRADSGVTSPAAAAA